MVNTCAMLLGERGFLYFAVADAGGADAQPLPSAVDQSMHGLQIHIPPALGDIVGMADAVPKLRPAATDFTNLCHKAFSLPNHASSAALRKVFDRGMQRFIAARADTCNRRHSPDRRLQAQPLHLPTAGAAHIEP